MSKHSDEAILAVSSLHKSYGDKAVLRDLNLNVSSGSIHGLVGLNGSGKTTTLECILGLQNYDSGEVRIMDQPPGQLYRTAGGIVGLFDTASLNPNLSVSQCLQQAVIMCPEPVHSPAEVMAMLGIESFAHYHIKQLSLGNKRRTSIAHALIGQPQLIILDEPFNGLDAGGVDEVLALIRRLNAETGTSFLLSSHQLPYLEQICSHIAILHQGHIQTSASVSELLADSGNSVLLKSSDPEAARKALQGLATVNYRHSDEAGYLHLQLLEGDSAELNRQLVNAGVPVAELIVQRASLDSLFRQLTQGDA